MLTYKAMYKYLAEGVHAEVLDFPGVISFGADLHEARRMLARRWWTWRRRTCLTVSRCRVLILPAVIRKRISKNRSTCS